MSPKIVAPRAEQDAAADPGRAARQYLLAADGDVLQDRHLVADDGEGTDDDAGGMIEEHLRSDRGRGMDADLKRVGRQALQQQCEIGAVAMPEPVRHPKGLQRDIALEVQQRRQKSRRRGIVDGNALQIAARRLDQIGRGPIRFAGDAREELAVIGALAEPLPDLMGDRIAKIGMIEDRGRERGPNSGSLAMALSASRPDRIAKARRSR